jgi:cytochrome c5
MRRFVLLSLPVVAAFVAVACGPTATSQPQSGPPADPRGAGGQPSAGATPSSPGQKVFLDQGCSRCHATPGEAASPQQGGPRTRAPELAKVGGKHDKAWISEHIRDAKKHSPMSNMPPYPEDKLPQKDLDTLAEFLAGLK